MKIWILVGLVLSVGTGVCFGIEAACPDLLISSYGGGASLVKNGQVVWTFGQGAKPCQDAWRLADGNFLIPTADTVQIVTPEKEIWWSYQGETPVELTVPPADPEKLKKWKPRTLEIHSCQPLPDGSVLIAEGAYARLLEVDRKGTVVKTIPLKGEKPDNHAGTRVVRKTTGGHYVAVINHDRVGEFDEEGTLIRVVNPSTTDGEGIQWKHVHGLAVLENGNWLIGTGYGATFFEIDPDDRVVWSCRPEDVPEIGMTYAAGCQRLADGTTVMAVFNSDYQVFAMDRNHQILWKWRAPDDAKFARGVTNVQVLDEVGDPSQFKLQK